MSKDHEERFISSDPKKLTCAEFQALLPELIVSDDDPDLHPHALSCEQCRLLAVDLEEIAEAARKLFPNHGPSIN